MQNIGGEEMGAWKPPEDKRAVHTAVIEILLYLSQDFARTTLEFRRETSSLDVSAQP